MAAETDTVAFLGSDGALIKAPFNLGTRETLWVPTSGEHLSRLRASPDGRSIAWITRASDDDTTRLWIGSTRQTRARVRYFSLQPRGLGVLHFEAETPTVEDRMFHGARLIVPNVMMRRFSSNALEWNGDGSAVLFGTHEGLAAAPADTGSAYEVSPSQVVDLRLLEPAPFYLAYVILATAAGRTEGWHLLYPTAGMWRLFQSSGLDPSDPWTASATTVWWASAKTIRAVRAHSPAPTVEVSSAKPVVWLEHDPARRMLAWISGRRVKRQPEEGGREELVFQLGADVKAVLTSSRGQLRGVIAGDSLAIWDLKDDQVRRVALGDFEPASLIETPSGRIFLTARGGGRDRPRLARVDAERRALTVIETPRLKNAIVSMSPSGARLILSEGGAHPPERLHVYDVETERWSEVTNPGITGWELLAPR